MAYQKFTGTYQSSDHINRIHYYIYEPETDLRAILQIVHDFGDFVERNENLIRFFTDHGVMVCGCDHIGHGRSSKKEDYGYFGSKNGWTYLVKKHREGELITRYIEASAAQAAVDLLLTLENEPVLVNTWIEQHINPALVNRMKQTIRARRKRHFNAEHQHTRKKSIDLEFMVWQRLAGLAQRRGKTLSETIVQLIEDAEHKEKYASKMSSLKHDLQVLLGKE